MDAKSNLGVSLIHRQRAISTSDSEKKFYVRKDMKHSLGCVRGVGSVPRCFKAQQTRAVQEHQCRASKTGVTSSFYGLLKREKTFGPQS